MSKSTCPNNLGGMSWPSALGMATKAPNRTVRSVLPDNFRVGKANAKVPFLKVGLVVNGESSVFTLPACPTIRTPMKYLASFLKRADMTVNSTVSSSSSRSGTLSMDLGSIPVCRENQMV